MKLKEKLHLFYITSIFSLIFAVLGFSYNAWRMELSEDNNNIRTAAFEMIQQLSEFEQILYAAHYDKDLNEGSPRKGWVKVGLIHDLSAFMGKDVMHETVTLKKLWSEQWSNVSSDEKSVQKLVMQCDLVRNEISKVLAGLR